MKSKHSFDNSQLLEMFQSQHRTAAGDHHMEENRQKIIAMAMKICVESSDEDDSNDSDTEVYRIAKKPRIQSICHDIEAIPPSDLNLIRRFSIELLPDQQNFLRLDDLTFEKLMTSVQSSMHTDQTGMKQPITIREKLVLTLSYLATGRNYNELVFNSPKTAQTINKIILETCDRIYKTLRGDYMKVSHCTYSKHFEHFRFSLFLFVWFFVSGATK